MKKNLECINGKMKDWSDDGKRLWGVYSCKNGIKDGPYETYNSKGGIRTTGNYVNNLKHGLETEYYPHLNPRSIYQKINYEHGKIRLLKKYYGEGGIKEENRWVGDNGEFIITEYYKNGQIISEGKCNKDHNYDGLFKVYQENGNLRMKLSFNKGNKHGEVIEYDEFERVIYTETWDDGLLVDKVFTDNTTKLDSKDYTVILLNRVIRKYPYKKYR